MDYEKVKIYSDGSHYIGIPRFPSKKKRRFRVKQKLYLVSDEDAQYFGEDRELTSRELFNGFYKASLSFTLSERKVFLYDRMKSYIKKNIDKIINANLERVRRNLIVRRMRLTRKLYLNGFHYFVTLTYDSSKIDEASFRKQAKKALSNFSTRYGWRFACVWERAPATNRLHLHGIFKIPEGTLPGPLIEVRDYSLRLKKMQTTFQCTYFNERFGRSDFQYLDNPALVGEAISYLCKYLEKSGERLFYSRNFPENYEVDILSTDVITNIGVGDRKILLYDDFKIIQEGEFLGYPAKDAFSLSHNIKLDS